MTIKRQIKMIAFFILSVCDPKWMMVGLEIAWPEVWYMDRALRGIAGHPI